MYYIRSSDFFKKKKIIRFFCEFLEGKKRKKERKRNERGSAGWGEGSEFEAMEEVHVNIW